MVATKILILKTGALGDVVRTNAILPGLQSRYGQISVTWVTALGAEDLVRFHPLVDVVFGVDHKNERVVLDLAAEFDADGQVFDRVLSFDDEQPLCALATAVGGDPAEGRLSGAYLTAEGERAYTDDVAPWFEMGLLSVLGKEEADRRKRANTESHPAIFARMLGIEMGEPALPLPDSIVEDAEGFAQRHGLRDGGPIIGLNTGSGGRWESKKLPVDRTVELALALREAIGPCHFVLLGGPEEAERNQDIGRRLGDQLSWVDAGVNNSLLEFTGIVGLLDLLITSDSLALHLANTQRVKVLAFFAPTPAPEIELYGRGRCVASTSPDYASYRKDADTSTLTVERLLPPALDLLGKR